MYTLLAAMDLPPTTKLRVAGASERPLPPRTARTVDDVLSEALRQRHDLLAGVAKLRATDAESRPHAPPSSRKFRWVQTCRGISAGLALRIRPT